MNDKKNNRLELLAPAGDMEKLRAAVKFGADAVYLAGEAFGMRKASKNFSKEDLCEAVEFAHKNNVKVHVTLNIIPHEKEFTGLKDYILFLDNIKVDAVIVSDPGIFMEVKKNSNIDIHISTQASVTNAETIKFWSMLGAKRVVLARELTIDEIREIRKKIPEDMELETFVHGAMCISYSGRCLLSNYMTGRDANQGDCAQACRWKYNLVEEKRPGEYFPVVEDKDGTFIMNSKDLCLLPELSELIDAGVTSFKIEGRVKTQYYVSTVIHAYRQALDLITEGKFTEEKIDYLLNELSKTSHRHFTKGFFYGNPKAGGQSYETSAYLHSYDFVGAVKAYDEEKKCALIEERNKISIGDKLEIFGSAAGYQEVEIDKIWKENWEEVFEANVPRNLFWIKVNEPVEEGDLIRKKHTEEKHIQEKRIQ